MTKGLKGNLKKGQIVTWGSDVPGFGRIVEIDEATQQATVKPLVLNDAGELVADGSRRLMKDLDVLSPSSRKLAPDSVGGYSNSVKKTGPTDTTADFSAFRRRWKAIVGTNFSRPPHKEANKAAGPSDEDLFRLQERLAGISNAEYGEVVRKFEARRVDLAAEPNADLSDDQLYQWGQDVLDGTDGRRRAERNVRAARQERLEYWRQQHELGRPLPRDLQEEIGG